MHRDIKPANVLLTDDEWGGLRVKVTDFGIAKAGSGTRRRSHPHRDRAGHAEVSEPRADQRRGAGRPGRPVLARGRALRDARRPAALHRHHRHGHRPGPSQRPTCPACRAGPAPFRPRWTGWWPTCWPRTRSAGCPRPRCCVAASTRSDWRRPRPAGPEGGGRPVSSATAPCTGSTAVRPPSGRSTPSRAPSEYVSAGGRPRSPSGGRQRRHFGPLARGPGRRRTASPRRRRLEFGDPGGPDTDRAAGRHLGRPAPLGRPGPPRRHLDGASAWWRSAPCWHPFC